MAAGQFETELNQCWARVRGRLRADVGEAASAVVLEEALVVPPADPEEVEVAVVVDVDPQGP